MQSFYIDGTYLSQNPTWHSEDAPWKFSHIQRVLAQAKLPDFASVIDIGCGSGDIIKLWAQQAPRVQFTGWDISPQACALARRQLPQNVQIAEGKHFPTEKFDVALAIDVLEHIEDISAWFKQFVMLAPYAVLHVPLDVSLRTVVFPSLLEQERQQVGHVHFFTARSLYRFLQEHGCQVLAAHYTNKYVERPPVLSRFKSKVGMRIRQLAHYGLPHAWAAACVGGYSLMLVIKTPAKF